MKATTWLCPVLTLLCATRIVCTAQRGGYPLDYADTNLIQDDYFLEKRNKPSLSIVNPLDVLRQRLLLEIARRQMKENTRQVELNRAILKNVGKRMPDWRHYQRQQRQQKQQYFPMQLDNYMPVTSIFDYLQGQNVGRMLAQQNPTLNYNKKQITFNDDGKKSLDTADDATTKYQLNGNEIDENEITNSGLENHGTTTSETFLPNTAAFYNDINNTGKNSGKHNEHNLMDFNRGGGVGGDVGSIGIESDLLNTTNNDNKNNGNDGIVDSDGNNGNYQLRYLYHLHRNHLARK